MATNQKRRRHVPGECARRAILGWYARHPEEAQRIAVALAAHEGA